MTACERETALFFMMAPKTRVKLKVEAASQAASTTRKKQRVSLESTDSISTCSETAPSAIATQSTSEGGSIAGPSSGLEEVSVADPSSSGDGLHIAGPSSRVVGDNIAGPSAGVSSEEGANLSAMEGVMEGDLVADSSPKTSLIILGKFVEDWLETLDKDETKSISLFLCYHLVNMFSFTETKAAEYAASMLKKNERTVRRWRSGLIDNDGVLPESQQGRYQRSGVLWQNEELNKKAIDYVRENSAVKGRPNLTTVDFCKWVDFYILLMLQLMTQ